MLNNIKIAKINTVNPSDNRLYPLPAVEGFLQQNCNKPVFGLLRDIETEDADLTPEEIDQLNVPDLAHCSIRADNLRIEGNLLLGDVSILDNDEGRALAFMVDGMDSSFGLVTQGTYETAGGVSVCTFLSVLSCCVQLSDPLE